MQINLKQTEIVKALRDYISNKGISLTGKTVACVFTAGRKDSGISVEIAIEDQEIPGYTDGSPEDPPETQPEATPVAESKAMIKTLPAAVAAPIFHASVAVAEATDILVAAPKPVPVNLFGSSD